MAAVAQYLADKSSLTRFHLSSVAEVMEPLVKGGRVATCPVVEFEMLWSTRSPAEFDQVRRDRSLSFEWLTIEDVDWRRVLDVQQQLWRTGSMRTVPLPDLLVAAVAERHRLTVLHYDADFELISALTDQPTEWVVPRGSVS
jgi:predicted nucleic acid-binding protein